MKDHNSNNNKRQDDSNSLCKVGERERLHRPFFGFFFFLDFCTPADDLRSNDEAPLVVAAAVVALTDVEHVVDCCLGCSGRD